MVSQGYKQYLQSQEWQKKRTERLKIDDYTCQDCNGKRDLQVHHLNYDNIFVENVYRDLITLCKDCHEKREMEKRKTPLSQEQKDRFFVRMLTFDFCKLNLANDYSGGGKVNFCKNDDIRPLLYEYLRDRGGNLNYLSVKQVNDFFRDKRYEVMERIYNEDPNIKTWELEKKTGFKYNMVDKWLKAKRGNKQ